MSGGYIGGYNADFKVVCNMDPPEVLDCQVTNIPGSGRPPLQVVAALPGNVNKYHVIDGVGLFIGVYKGPVGLEVLQFIMGGGADMAPFYHALKKGDRICIRNMSPEPVTRGGLVIQFCRG